MCKDREEGNGQCRSLFVGGSSDFVCSLQQGSMTWIGTCTLSSSPLFSACRMDRRTPRMEQICPCASLAPMLTMLPRYGISSNVASTFRALYGRSDGYPTGNGHQRRRFPGSHGSPLHIHTSSACVFPPLRTARFPHSIAQQAPHGKRVPGSEEDIGSAAQKANALSGRCRNMINFI